MDLKDIYDELQQIDNLDSSVSYEEFLSLFQNFDHITTIRKDLIRCGYDVVEPVEFFSEIVNEIPNLQETEFKKNEIFNFKGENFLIHTKFSNYTSFTQEIHRFNETEEIELMDTVSDIKKYYSLNKSYLTSLNYEYTTDFIEKKYSTITYPLISKLYSNKVNSLLSNDKRKEALAFVKNGKDMLEESDYSVLQNKIESSIKTEDLYSKTRVSILNELERDKFDKARDVLKTVQNTLNIRFYNELLSLINEKEEGFENVINMKDQAEKEEAEEYLEKGRRDVRMREKEEEYLEIRNRNEEIEAENRMNEERRRTNAEINKMEHDARIAEENLNLRKKQQASSGTPYESKRNSNSTNMFKHKVEYRHKIGGNISGTKYLEFEYEEELYHDGPGEWRKICKNMIRTQKGYNPSDVIDNSLVMNCIGRV
jgi:hypothetical protein